MTFLDFVKALCCCVIISALTTACTRQASEVPANFAFINKSGQIRIQLPPSQYAESFSDGLAAVRLQGKWGYIDETGSWVIKPQFSQVSGFSEGLAPVAEAANGDSNRTGKFGFINRKGRFVVAPQF